MTNKKFVPQQDDNKHDIPQPYKTVELVKHNFMLDFNFYSFTSLQSFDRNNF